MEVIELQEVSFQLTLTPKEAHFLKRLVQNARCAELSDEDQDIRELRLRFWNSLPSIDEFEGLCS